MLHHLSSLRLSGGMCEVEEDAECLLVKSDGERIRAHDSLLVFWLLSPTLQPWSGPIIPLVAESKSNTKTLLHSLSPLWNNACCRPSDTSSLTFPSALPGPCRNVWGRFGFRWASAKREAFHFKPLTLRLSQQIGPGSVRIHLSLCPSCSVLHSVLGGLI